MTKDNRQDGFYNALNSVGTSRDQGTQTQWRSRGWIVKEKLDEVYAENALFAKIINLYPDDGLRRWIDYNHDMAEQINELIDMLMLKKQLRRAARRERLHGGCAIFMDIDDGQEPDQPLNYDNIRSINKLMVFENDYIFPFDYKRSGDPEMYQLQSYEMSAMVHASRLLVFPGIEVSDDYKYYNSGWGESVGRRVLEAVERREMALNALQSLSGRMVIPVWGIEGLTQLVDDDDNESLKNRMQAKLIGESIVNSVVIDTNDKFEMLSVNLSGIKELMMPLDRDVIQVSGIPHTKLFGESPGASLGATGGSQERDWHKTVAAYQEDNLRHPIQQFLNIVTAMMKTDKVKFEFNPLDEPSMSDMANVHLNQARADQIYEQLGVLLPEEIRNSRFANGYSLGTELDDELYGQQLNLDMLSDESEEIQ